MAAADLAAYALALDGPTIPGYIPVWTLILNLIVSVVRTPVLKRGRWRLRRAADRRSIAGH